MEKTLLGLSPHSFDAAAHVIKTAVKSCTGIFFFSQNNYCKIRMMFVCWKEKEKMLGIRTAASDFFEPFFSNCDPLFAGFETLIEMVWVWEEVILAQEVRQMVLANGTAGSCSVVQHSGGG